ncbi:MAG TPA: glyoxalase [Betaproteobacteria bacterium]|jgi:catechol 2,3-dioxygenase-like lactoylglutathione lyase family enzyme|nr:glyoxalase [Betaproteobacteria bacterium]
MPATAMNHFTILTDNVDETIKFYNEFLGLESGERPPFDFPGAWLYAGNTAVLHVIGGRALPESREGVIDHMAFSATGLIETIKKLERHEIDYSLRQVRPSDPWQLFFFDPSGAKVELDYPSDEPTPKK